MKDTRHYYIYGRPVKGMDFVNRESELKTVFNRLRNGESSAIIGEPHIGKTSFLLKLADGETQKAYLAACRREKRNSAKNGIPGSGQVLNLAKLA